MDNDPQRLRRGDVGKRCMGVNRMSDRETSATMLFHGHGNMSKGRHAISDCSSGRSYPVLWRSDPQANECRWRGEIAHPLRAQRLRALRCRPAAVAVTVRTEYRRRNRRAWLFRRAGTTRSAARKGCPVGAACCRLVVFIRRVGAATAATTAQHLHAVAADLGHRFRRLPCRSTCRTGCGLRCRPAPFFRYFTADFGSAADELNAVPVGTFLLATGLVFPLLGGRDRERCHGFAAGQVAHFGSRPRLPMRVTRLTDAMISLSFCRWRFASKRPPRTKLPPGRHT